MKKLLILIFMLLIIGQATVSHAISEFKITASDAMPEDRFGGSVAISGDTAIVGVDSDELGFYFLDAAHIFVRDGPTWTQQTKLIASDTKAGDHFYFGSNVAIDGDTAIIAAPVRPFQLG